MSTQTPNFGLVKPAPDDFYDVNVQNGNMDILDSASARLDENGSVPVTQGGTGSGTVQGALHALRAKPRENLLINADFRRPVNRQGQTEYMKPNGYTIDRWMTTADDVSVYVTAEGVTLKSHGNISWDGLEQPVESYGLYLGKTLTCSFLVKGEAGKIFAVRARVDASGAKYTNAFTANGERQLISLTFTLDEDASMLNIIIASYQTAEEKELLIEAAKLEEGGTQTLAYQDDNGEWQLLNTPDYDAEYLRCCMYSLTDGAFVGLPYSNENLLDNWYFPDPINQRGQTVYTAQGYTVDRWIANGSQTITLTGSGLTLPGSFYQMIEKNRLTPNIPYTLSILTDVACSMWLNFGSCVGSVYGKMHTVTGINTDTNDSIRGAYFNADTAGADNAHLIACKLEMGISQTLARQDENGNWVLCDPPPDRALELAKCQRYFMALPPQSPSSYAPLGTLITNNAPNQWNAEMPVPVTMRTAPVVTFVPGSVFVRGGTLAYQSVNVGSANAIEAGPIGAATVLIGGTDLFTDLDRHTLYSLWTGKNSTFRLFLSADL